MKYFVNLDEGPNSVPTVVDVVEKPSGDLLVSIGDRTVPVDVVALHNAISVRVSGRVIDLTTEGAPPEMGVIANGHRAYVRVESERQRAAAAASKTGSAGSDSTESSTSGATATAPHRWQVAPISTSTWRHRAQITARPLPRRPPTVRWRHQRGPVAGR